MAVSGISLPIRAKHFQVLGVNAFLMGKDVLVVFLPWLEGVGFKVWHRN